MSILVETFGDWVAITDPLFEPMREALEGATSYAELRAAMLEAVTRMDRSALADAIARATAKARGLGDVED
ncbi:Uncharacterised protein [Starkeya nomas]|uniref:Uncharacterized protein n=1 Tax=Starkeya nomas TaxID=2666134 RepID=A0A5S9R6G9_9HYPH|nr:Uncharacterised protein [Starkeya nomas]